jgi:hypothetical protein
MEEHSASAPEHLRAVGVWPPEWMHRALLSPPAWNWGLFGEVQQARLLQQVRQECKPGVIGTQDFADQHEAQ